MQLLGWNQFLLIVMSCFVVVVYPDNAGSEKHFLSRRCDGLALASWKTKLVLSADVTNESK